MNFNIMFMMAASFVFWMTNRRLRKTIKRQRDMLLKRKNVLDKQTSFELPITKTKLKKQKKKHKKKHTPMRISINAEKPAEQRLDESKDKLSDPATRLIDDCENFINIVSADLALDVKNKNKNKNKGPFILKNCVSFNSIPHYLPPTSKAAAWQKVLWCAIEVSRETKSTVVKKKTVDRKFTAVYEKTLKKVHNEPQRQCRIKGLLTFDKERNGNWSIKPEGFQRASELFSLYNIKSPQKI